MRWERLLSAYLEAGGTAASFWRETPRTTMLTILAYRRRRGWQAWHSGALARFEFKDGYPSVEAMMGVPKRVDTRQQQVMLAHNLRLWRSVLNRKDAAGEA